MAASTNVINEWELAYGVGFGKENGMIGWVIMQRIRTTGTGKDWFLLDGLWIRWIT